MSTILDWITELTLSEKSEPRREIMIFPYGEFEHPTYGKMVFDNNFFSEIIHNYKANVLGIKPFIDQQHDEDKALAWIDEPPFIRPGLGLFIRPKWTELGETMLSKKIYQYFSPSWGPFKDPQSGREYKNVLRGGAATNIPFLKTMPPIVEPSITNAAEQTVSIKLSELFSRGSVSTGGVADEGTQTTQMLEEDKQGKNMKNIAKIFGLSETATEEEILASIEAMKAANAQVSKELSEVKSRLSEVPATEKALTEKLQLTESRLNEVSMKLTKRNCEEVIVKVLSEGKIRPADKEYWEGRLMADFAGVSADFDKMGKVIDLSETGSSSNTAPVVDEDPGHQLVKLSQEIAAEKKIAFDAAYAKVCNDNPELVKAYHAKYAI